MHILSRKQVNIYIKPVPTKHPFKVTEVTIGDLHANVVKLIYFLVINGIIFMNDAVYERLVQLYKTPPEQWTQNYFQELARVVKSFVVINNEVLVRILGDEVADRGPIDISILWFLEEFVKQEGLIQIHVSNHGFEFMTYMEFHINNPTATAIPLDAFALFGRYGDKFTVSLVNLHSAILKGFIAWKEVRHLYEVVYRPLLRVMTYSICPQTEETHLFSHAEAGLETLSALGECFGVDFTKQTIKSITDSIANMNHVFQKHYASVNRTTHDGCYQMKEMINPLSKFSALAHLVWRRAGEHGQISSPGQLEYGGSHQDKSIRTVKWFHGHHPEAQRTGHSFSLDCNSGKTIANDAFDYIDLVSENLPKAMLIYDRVTLPKLQEQFSAVPQAAQSNLTILLEKLRKLMFRFVAMTTHLQQHERTAFEEEKESLVKEMVGLSPHPTPVDSLLHEENILDCLELPLEAIYSKNERPISVVSISSFDSFFASQTTQESVSNAANLSFNVEGCPIA